MQEKLNKQGQDYIASLRQAVHVLWEAMCKEEGIPPDSKFVVFSKATEKKFRQFYDRALNELWEAEAQYRAGGYVGLKIKKGR
ncbi:MAG: hypothetical protein ABSF21_00210 [Dehalococcoidia bacterium]|jgi:tRNA(Leu) C34 or U34 (ribose-2'-O)-methylase TrmL